MAILAGYINTADKLGHEPLFDLNMIIPTFECQGFDHNLEWYDDVVQFSKFGRSDLGVIWHQPITTDAGVTIIADARLHDRDNLRHRLGISKSNATDIELIIAAYKLWGRDCVQHFIGDYAFAIWDAPANILFCARDHIGAKSFYYMHQDDEFVFANDIRAILDAAKTDVNLDIKNMTVAIDNHKAYDRETTHYQGVKKLMPGHYMIVKPGYEPQITRYWKPENIAPLILDSDDEYADALLSLIDIVVADCLYIPGSDATDGHASAIGVHVSGGLDSSAIAVLALRHLDTEGRPKPLAFCWQAAPTVDEEASQEHQWLQAMVRQEEINLHYVRPNPEIAYQLLLNDATRTPNTSTLSIEIDIQHQAQALGVGVILSGWGGDEFTSHNGRNYFPWLFKTGRWLTLIKNLRDFDDNSPSKIFHRVFLPIMPNILQNFITGLKKNPKGTKQAKSLLHSEMKHHLGEKTSNVHGNRNVRDTQLDLLYHGHINERIESWAIYGRKFGIEYRYPLLDRRLIEFALSLPPHQYKKGRWKRFVFRNAMRNILPDVVRKNLSKNEPVRVEASSQNMVTAMRRIGKEIRDGILKPERCEYIDMPRLLNILEGKSKERHGAALQALRFIKFK